MSTTLTVTAMVAELQLRVPLGFTTGYLTDRLNEAFRRIEQMDSFPWMLWHATLAVTTNSVALTGVTGIDPGRPIFLQMPGPPLVEIPYVDPGTAFLMDAGSASPNLAVEVGKYDAFTVAYTTAGIPTLYLYPVAAAGTATLLIRYHRLTPAPISGGAFFPSPDEFDDLIVLMAESDIKRLYRLSDWQSAEARAQASAQRLMAQYRSTRATAAPLTEQLKETQEIGAKRED